MHHHVTKAVHEARFSLVPWPHLIVNNVFPPTFYQDMLANLPKQEDMFKFAANRFMYWLVKDGSYALVSQFWAKFREGLFEALTECLEEKFDVVPRCIGAEVLHDYPGYGISPHTDTPDKLITGLFYLPSTDVAAKQGTVLYHCDTPDPRGKGHKLTNEFKPIKTVPYSPNTALFFLRTDLSYHGVRATPVERWILAFDGFR